MSEKKLGLVLAVDGEQEFKQQIISINKSLTAMKSELSLVTAKYDGQANSLQALAEKDRVLNNILQEQKNKFDKTNEALQNAESKHERLGKAVEELQKSFDKENNVLNDLKTSYETAKQRLQEMEREGTSSEKTMKKQGDAVKALEEAVKKQEKAVDESNTELSTAQNEYRKCGNLVNDWKSKLNTAEAQVIKANSAVNKNAAYLKEAEEATDECAKSIDKFGKEVKKSEKVTTDWGEKIKSALVTKGTSMAVDSLGKLKDKAAEAAEYVVEVGSSFEAAMSEVAAISGVSESDLDAMTGKAKELGSSTKFSATEAAEAFKYMSLAGWDTKTMLSSIDGVMTLAAASGMELAAASDMVTDYLSAFGMEASKSAYFADILAYAQSNSNTTAEQLGEAYKNCAANLNAAGQDVETTTSLLEAMANQGLKGSEAGTALNAMMRDITSNMKDGKIAIGSTNVEVADAQGNFRDLTEVLKDVEKATEGMGDADKSAALQATFTSDSVKGLNLVLNEGVGNVENYETALRNSGGAAQNMADTMQDNLAGKITEFNSAVEGLGIQVFDYISGPAQGIVEGATSAINAITEAITPQKDTFETFVEDVEAANEQLRTTLKNAEDTMGNASAEAIAIGNLGGKLLALNSVEAKSLEQRYELRTIVTELGQSIPEIAAAYDEEAGKIGLTNSQIETLIKNKQALLVANAAQASKQKVVNAMFEAEQELLKSDETLAHAAEVRDALQNEYDSVADMRQRWVELDEARGKALTPEEGAAIADEMNAIEQSFDELGISIDGTDNYLANLQEDLNRANADYGSAKKANDDLNESYKEGEKQLKSIDHAQQAMEQRLNKLSGSTENAVIPMKEYGQTMEEINTSAGVMGIGLISAADSVENFSEKVVESNKTAAEAAKAGAEAQKEAAKSILDTYNGYVSEIKSDLQEKINPFEKFDTSKYSKDYGENATVEKMTKNLDGQIEAFESYQESLEAVKDHVGKEISPEFMQYLEDMGIEGKNTLDHILQTFADGEPEKVKELNDKWIRAMNLTEGIAEVQAANKVAYETAMGELGSSDADFSELKESINGAVTGPMQDELNSAVDMAQQMGIKIPDGLAEGIASGETSPEEALAQLNGAMQGAVDALVEMANKAGVDIDMDKLAEGIAAGGQDAVDAYSELVASIIQKCPELQKAIEEGTKTDGVKASVESGTDSGAEAIDEAVPTYQEKSKALGEAIVKGIEESKEALKTAVSGIVQAGADGISENEEAYRQAGAILGEKVSEGLQEAVSEDGGAVILNPDGISDKSGEYEKAGESLGKAVVSGLQNTQKEINDALSPDTEVLTSKAGDYESAGQQLGSVFATALGSEKESAGGAGKVLSDAAIESIQQQLRQIEAAGKQQSQTYATALSSARQQAAQSAGAMANAARNALASYQNSFYSVGVNMASGLASGIRAGQSGAISAARSMAAQALAAAKAELDIHSPSRKFRDQVGAQISTGMAFGIKDKASLAGKQAKQMSNRVYTNAVSWLSKYKKSQQVSLADEKWYWQEVLKHTKSGTTAYNNALKKIQAVSTAELTAAGVSSAAATQITKNFGVSKTTGSGKKKKTKDEATYYSEIYSAAEKYLSNQQVLNEWSLQQQLAYWNAVKSNLKSGTQAWYDATKQVNSLQSEIIEAEKKAAQERIQTRANVQKDLLSKYKVYNDMSAKAEMQYWDIARKQFAAGTDERIEADENYLKAKDEYYEQQKELDEEYAESKKKIDDELADSIKELQETYDDAVKSRKKEILSSMNLFESWDAEGYKKDALTSNLKSQVDGLKFWEQQMEELSKKNLSKELLDELAEMGPEAAANIWSLNQMTAEELEEYNRLWTEKNSLAHKQALQDNENLLKETQDSITEARKKAQDEMSTLQSDYRKAVSELNTGLSDGLKGLVEQAGKIGEEIVSKLVNAVKDATSSAETKKALADAAAIINSSENSANTQSSSQTATQQATAQQAAAQQAAAQQAAAQQAAQQAAAAEAEKKQILAIINSGKSHAKKLSSKEKKEHHALWEYIVEKYGRVPTYAIYKKLADALGVKADAKATSAQKNNILAALKKKGYARGTRRVPEDELAWLWENGAQEYLVRTSDGAIMQNMLQGDKVINPQGAENVYNMAMNPEKFIADKVDYSELLNNTYEQMQKQQASLQSQTAALDFSGIAKLNRLTEQYQPQPAAANVDNKDLTAAIRQLTEELPGMIAEALMGLQMVTDTGVLAGELQRPISQENAAVTIRRNRGRLR